jgi:hypothetical protein
VQTALDSTASAKTALAKRRARLVATAAVLLDAYHVATVLAIQTLESVACGAVVRHARSRAEFWAARAREVSLETGEKEARGRNAVYTPEVRGALENYVRALRDGRERLREKRKGAERALWGYGVGREDGEKEKVMKEIARVYGELVKEIAEVGRDVERLRGGTGRGRRG